MTPQAAARRAGHRISAGTLVAALVAGLTGCGAGDPAGSSGSAGPAGEPDAVEATPRSLVAAVEGHLGRSATIAAPLYARDFYGSEKPPRGTVAVEVAFDEEVGDNSHLQLLVTGGPSMYSRFGCEPGDEPEPCVQDTTDDGDERVLTWEQAAVESDPGGDLRDRQA